MNKNIFFTILLVVFMSVPVLFTSCNSCSDRRTGDIDKLPGVYRGEATIVLPDHVKAMVPPEAKGMIPEGPIPCGIEIQADTNETLALKLVDFTMPVRGITVDAATATITSTNGIFSLKGNGNVSVGSRKMSYTHEGTIKNDSLALDITVSIIPFVVEPKIVFKGKITRLPIP
ncbi:calycin-like domain-containing protein [Butyricimonas hominis]|uniref:calycin-like domain-containing protein n=1 Tax=Butyricimonas hominis TaxID=2763032 RepID=UPI0026DCBF84|nr:calycin-like domain-containing protein [uncultured Butyricimonas sp.]